jgi:hypothetical protein
MTGEKKMKGKEQRKIFFSRHQLVILGTVFFFTEYLTNVFLENFYANVAKYVWRVSTLGIDPIRQQSSLDGLTVVDKPNGTEMFWSSRNFALFFFLFNFLLSPVSVAMTKGKRK